MMGQFLRDWYLHPRAYFSEPLQNELSEWGSFYFLYNNSVITQPCIMSVAGSKSISLGLPSI
jgi:hypothetical protein